MSECLSADSPALPGSLAEFHDAELPVPPHRDGLLRRTGSSPRWGLGPLLVAMLVVLLNDSPNATAQLSESAFGSSQPALPDSLRDDATLHAVTFADVDRGWAVGDRGVIWYTEDGGDSWQPQASGTRHPLFDVSFADPRRGIAVGGSYEPQTQISRAVVLVTTNGGRRWDKLENDLPLLRTVSLGRDGSVVAAGDYSPIHLSCLFRSDDAGRQWTPLLPGEMHRVEAVTGNRAGPLTVLDSDGILHRYADLQTEPVASAGAHHLRSLGGAQQTRLAVGASGTVLLSQDAGRRWNPLSLTGTLRHYEWFAADEAEGTMWCIGAPGNTVLKIDPQGAASTFATPVNVAMHDIAFFDAQRGWAVGAFGTVIATRDGGKTWRCQRGAGRRAAILAVAAEPAALPWPALASESLEMGRRFVVCLDRTDLPNAKTANDPLVPAADELATQAASRLGGGGLAWVRGKSEEANAQVEQHLQAYRPQVLLLDRRLPRETRQRWTRAAMDHRIGRVFETCDADRSDLTVHGGAILPRAGAMTEDLWRDALSLLSPAVACPEAIHLRCTFDAVARSQRSIDGLFAGLPVGDPADSRPLREQASRRLLQVLRARAGQRTLADRLVQEGNRRGAFAARLDMLIDQTPQDSQASLLQDVLQRCRQHDRPELYRQTLRAASERLGDWPTARLARLRMQAIEQSGEWQALHQAHVGDPTVMAAASQTAGAVKLSPFAEDQKRLDPNELVQTVASFEKVQDAQGSADAVDGSISSQAIDLSWDFDPRTLLVRQAVNRLERQEGEEQEPRDANLRRWRDAAAMRLWAGLAGVAPEAATPIARVAQFPRLDGRLDEPFWRDAEVLADDAGFVLRIAYDAQYLYWSIEGPAPVVQPSSAALDDQRRDAMLDDQTRAMLQVDIDGDLLTAFGLEVDPTGRTRDTCDGFAGWHPMWFVDSRIAGDRWIVEAAVRRKDMQPLPLAAEDRWQFRFRVLKPGQLAEEALLPSAGRWVAGRFH